MPAQRPRVLRRPRPLRPDGYALVEVRADERSAWRLASGRSVEAAVREEEQPDAKSKVDHREAQEGDPQTPLRHAGVTVTYAVIVARETDP